MSVALKAKIAEVFEEPGCDINQARVRRNARRAAPSS